MSLFWGENRGLGSDFASGKVVWCVCAGCGVCTAWGIENCVWSLLCCLWVSLSDRHFLSSLTCLLSEPGRTRSVAAFLPLPPCPRAALSFSREQGNMTGVDMRHAEPNNASFSQACSGLGAGPASSLCCWLIGSKKGFLPLVTDGLKGDS